jgi:hypothetical protein
MRMIGSIRVEFVFVTDFPARGRSLSSLSLSLDAVQVPGSAFGLKSR